MKKLILQFLILGLATAVFADDLPHFSITTNQAVEIKQKLEAFDKGDLNLDEAAPNSLEWCKQVAAYYILHTNDVSVRMKLPIARCFVVLNDYPEAAKLASEYVNVCSNDYRGWRILGGAKLIMKSYDEGLVALTNAARLGDDKNYASLGLVAVRLGRLDILQEIVVPNLLVLKDDAQNFPAQERLQMREILIAYALKANDKNIFLKALEGVTISDMVSLKNLKNLVLNACDQFSGKDIDKIRQEMAAAASSTNSVSSPVH